MERETIFIPMLASSPDEEMSLLILLLKISLPGLFRSERGGAQDMYQTTRNIMDRFVLNKLDIIQGT